MRKKPICLSSWFLLFESWLGKMDLILCEPLPSAIILTAALTPVFPEKLQPHCQGGRCCAKKTDKAGKGAPCKGLKMGDCFGEKLALSTSLTWATYETQNCTRAQALWYVPRTCLTRSTGGLSYCTGQVMRGWNHIALVPTLTPPLMRCVYLHLSESLSWGIKENNTLFIGLFRKECDIVNK